MIGDLIMSELKPMFLDIARAGIIEFVCNHPGKNFSASALLENCYNVPEEALVRAYEQYKGKLYPAFEEFVRYQFSGAGKNKNFPEPKWLADPDEKKKGKK